MAVAWHDQTQLKGKQPAMFKKVAVIGAGNVGATAAQRVAEKNLAREVIMIDVAEGIPQGKALDQWQSGPIEGFDARIRGSQGYEEAKGAELFIVTAGIARKPGMSRDDLVRTNAGIVRSVSEVDSAITRHPKICRVGRPAGSRTKKKQGSAKTRNAAAIARKSLEKSS